MHLRLYYNYLYRTINNKSELLIGSAHRVLSYASNVPGIVHNGCLKG